MKLILIGFIFLNFGFSKAQEIEDCSTCSSKVISAENIKNLSTEEMQFLKNDLLARKGYSFKETEIGMFFFKKDWYKPIKSNKEIKFNAIEKQNIEIFSQLAEKIEKERADLIEVVKEFKVLMLSKNYQEVLSKYDFNLKDYNYKLLIEVLMKINLDDINWASKFGFHGVTIDNGIVLMNFEVKLFDDIVVFKYSNQGYSKHKKVFYASEYIEQFSYYWSFTWEDGKFKFLEFELAG